MPKVCRVGDKNNGKGIIQSGVNSVQVNDRPIAVVGGKITPHPKGAIHSKATVQKGSQTVYADGKPVTYVGAADTCKHTHTTGSNNVYVGG